MTRAIVTSAFEDTQRELSVLYPGKMRFIIGVCAYNERQGIHLLFRRLLAEGFHHELHSIIVVSSSSTDGTDEEVQSFADDRIRLVREETRRGKYSAVNEILRRACSEGVDVLVLIPADVVPRRGAIDSLVSKFRDPTVGCVSGHPVVQNGDGVMGKTGRLLWEIHNETFKYHSFRGTITHASGELMAVRPKAVQELPRVVVDDGFLANIARRRGFRVVYDEHADVLIWVPTGLRDFWKQRKRNLQGLRYLRERGLSLQTLSYERIPIAFPIIMRVMRRNPDLMPFIPLLLSIELLGRVFARFGATQGVAWEMVTTAKPGVSAL